MVTLHAWAKPANLIGKWADHTWVTTYDNRQAQPGSLEEVASAGEHLWMCWGAFHPRGGAPGHADGLIVTGDGRLPLAGCVVQANADSVKVPAARGTVSLYGIHGVCHQVANQVLHATATANAPPVSVRGSRGYYKSVYFYRQYGRRDSAWAAKLDACLEGSGVDAMFDDGDDFTLRAQRVLTDRNDLLGDLLARRRDFDAELDAMGERADITAEELDARLRNHLVEVAGQLGQQRFEAIFEQDVEDEMNLIDRDIFAASRADPAAG